MFLAIGTCDIAGAASGDEVALPPDVAPIWAWLPADTETVMVARNVPFDSPFGEPPKTHEKLTDEERRLAQQQALVALNKQLALGALHSLRGGNVMQPGSAIKLLGKRRAPLVVYGGRGYEVVSAFGSFRYHGASIVTFAEDDAAALDEWLVALEKDASEVRTIGDCKVLAFPYDKNQMEPVFKPYPWQGTYVARVAPLAVVCATSDVYLKELFDRIDRPQANRAIPPQAPEWKYVDATASAWGVRRIPAFDGQKLAGIVWLTQPSDRQTFEVIYLPTEEENLDLTVESWFRAWFTDPSDRRSTTIERHKDRIQVHGDGATHLTIPLEEIGRTVMFPIFQVHHLQGFQGKLVGGGQ